MAIVGYRLSVFIKNESLNDFAGYDMADSTGGHALHLLPNDRLAPSLVQKIGKNRIARTLTAATTRSTRRGGLSIDYAQIADIADVHCARGRTPSCYRQKLGGL